MSIVRITKEFRFEMAHALYGYDGLCKNIHGHSYSLSITVSGKIDNNKNSPKTGMVMDFTELKNIVQSVVVEKLDHSLLLNGNSPHKEFVRNEIPFERIVLVKYQPTCENLLVDIAGMLKKNLPKNIKLHHLCLRETPNSYAEWYAEDNKAV